MPRGGHSSPPAIEAPLPTSVLATFRKPAPEWEEQKEALQALAATAKSYSASPPHSPARQEFLRQLRDVTHPLILCISNLRSSLVKEASICVIQCVEVFGPLFVTVVGNALVRPILDRTSSSKQVIRESAFEAGKAMFDHGVTGFSPDVANMLCEYVHNSKVASPKRAAAAQFLGMVLIDDCLGGLQSILPRVKKAVVDGCCDSDERVRAYSRENWRKLESLDRPFAHQLLNELPAYVVALIEREKGDSPRSEKSAGHRVDHKKSPGSPARNKSVHRYQPSAKRLHPLRVTSDGAVESADLSPSAVIRQAMASHTTTTTSLTTSRAGRAQRLGAARVPRSQNRAIESGNSRPALPPRPGHPPRQKDGKPQAGSALARQAVRPSSRLMLRPARRSMAPNTKIVLQGNSPDAALEARRKARQSVPAPIAKAMTPGEQGRSLVPPRAASDDITSPPPKASSDGQDSEFFTPSPIARAAVQARQLPDSYTSEESLEEKKVEANRTSVQYAQGIPRTSSGDSFVTAQEERKSPSLLSTAIGIASTAFRSLRSTPEPADAAEVSSPRPEPMDVDTPLPVSPSHELSDFASLSSVESDDRGDRGAEEVPQMDTSQNSLRKARLSYILRKTDSPQQFEKHQLQPVLPSTESSLGTSVSEATDQESMHKDDIIASQSSSGLSLAEGNEPTNKPKVNEAVEPTAEEVELLMSMHSLQEYAEKPSLFTNVDALTAATSDVKSAESITSKDSNEEAESSRGTGAVVEIDDDEKVVVHYSPDKPRDIGEKTQSTVIHKNKIANDKENASPDEANPKAVVVGKDRGKVAEKDTAPVSELEDGEPTIADAKTEERKPLTPAKVATANVPSIQPPPMTLPALVKPEEPPRDEKPPARPVKGSAANALPWKTNKASDARMKVRRSMMPGVAIRPDGASTLKNGNADKKDIGHRLPRRVPTRPDPSGKPTGRAAYMVAASTNRKPRAAMPQARRSLMPGTKIHVPPTAAQAKAKSLPGPSSKPPAGSTTVNQSDKGAKAGPAPPSSKPLPGSGAVKRGFGNKGAKTGPAPLSNKPPPGGSALKQSDGNKGGKTEPARAARATVRRKETKKESKTEVSSALHAVMDWLRQAKRIKNGDWKERCQALKGFAEACKQLEGDRISMGLADECMLVLGEYIRQGHHRVISEALDGLFFLLLCSTGSSHTLQKALEKRDEVVRRTVGLLVAGRDNVRLAAGRVMQSFEVQFTPEVMVGLIMRALRQGKVGSGGGLADLRVAEMGCVQLSKAFERAATSGEEFVWKTGLLESVLKGLETLVGHRRVAVRKAAQGVVERVKESLPERAFELACDKYGVSFEGK